MKRLVIDVDSVASYFTIGLISGIGRTTMELVQALDKIRAELPFEIMLYSQNLRGSGSRNLSNGFKYRHLWMRNNENWNKWVKRLHLRELLTGYDMLHIPHNFEHVACPEKTVLTIHDMLLFEHPESFCKEEDKSNVRNLAQRCRHIITISQSSKNAIIRHLDVPEEKISVIEWGVDRNILYPHTVKANPYIGNNPYFLCVSCNGGRKNTISVVQAYAEFCKNDPDHHLILVWGNPTAEVRQIIESNHLQEKVHFVSNLTNEELGHLYAGAAATFYPSLYEGFGLPILESMTCGVPVVTCRNSSLEEVGGDAAIYVHPYDIRVITKIMEDFENGSIDLDDLRPKLLNQASKFSWDICAHKTVDVYRKALEI